MNFSLLEVNLVILIIALLFSVSLKALGLYHHSNLHAYIVEVSAVTKDVREFYQIYDFYPGDFPLATMMWSGACVDFSNGDNICNGDGDAKIVDQSEGYLAWVHLNKLRNQLFTTKEGVVKSKAVIGYNVKDSKAFPFLGMQILGDTKLNNSFFDLRQISTNFLRIAAEKDSGNLLNSAFTPRDLYFVDKKIDDGFPQRGISLGDTGNDAILGCITNDKKFNLKVEEKICYQQIAID